jgi:hypothetical protein
MGTRGTPSFLVTVIVRHNRRVAYETVQRDECLIYVLHMDHCTPTELRMQEAWPKSDLLFSSLSLRNGMPIAEVAGFLARSEDEVREKSEELRRFA